MRFAGVGVGRRRWQTLELLVSECLRHRWGGIGPARRDLASLARDRRWTGAVWMSPSSPDSFCPRTRLPGAKVMSTGVTIPHKLAWSVAKPAVAKRVTGL